MDEIELSQDEERVFAAASAVEIGGGYASDVARAAGLPEDRTRELLSNLVRHDLLVEDYTEQPGNPDLGPRYRVREQPS